MLGPTVFGHGTPTAVLFPPDYWAALQAEVPATDIERAKQLLADAGLPDGDYTGSVMSEVIDNTTSRWNAVDRRAMVAYLRSLPPLPGP